MRVTQHPILGQDEKTKEIIILVDDKPLSALEGDTIASALIANQHKVFRFTRKQHQPRGVFCSIGRCNDCLVTVNGIPNVRACITPVEEGMIIKTQIGNGSWEEHE